MEAMSPSPTGETRSQFFQECINKLIASMPPIEAFGIGGSIGAGAEDGASDLDFFVLVPDDLLLAALSSLKASLAPVGTFSEGKDNVFVSGFGFRFSYIAPGKGVEYFVTSHSMLQPNVMQLKTQILKDTTGFLSQHILSLATQQASLRDSALTSLWHEIYTELEKLHKYLLRAEELAFDYRLVSIRRYILALDRIAHLGELVSPHDADRRVPLHLRNIYTGIPLHHRLSTVHKLHTRFTASIQRLSEGERPTPQLLGCILGHFQTLIIALEANNGNV